MTLTHSKPTSRQTWTEVLFLFCATLFIRLPFFFRDYIDVDESTFILMGQSVADGNQPYLHLWDLKPPLLFYFFGGIEYLFPRSFIAIRFTAVLVIFVSAFFLQRIAIQHRLRNPFLIALGYVLLSSLFGSLQGFMSEHLAVFFLLPGIYLLHKDRPWAMLLAGVFFSCSLMSKLSYGYGLALLMVLIGLWTWRKKGFLVALGHSVLLGLGLIIPILCLAIPYYVQGKLQVFTDSVFLAPLAYAKAQPLSFGDKLANTWWINLVVALLSMAVIKTARKEQRYHAAIFLCLLLGTTYTFFASGLVNGHYLVMIYPFVLLLVLGLIIRKDFRLKKAVLVLAVLLVAAESHLEYYRIAKNYLATGSPYYRTSFKAVAALRSRNLADEKIFFTHYHIGYWLLNQYPLTRSTTHPSNINRPYLFPFYGAQTTVLAELRYLMDTIRPDVLVSKEVTGVSFMETGAEREYFRKVVATDYRQVYQNTEERLFIWQRK
ncbi:hypothetical protein SAMN05444008_10712 [Cnuella takakiae]|uniref:Dolichyl-phosphate-mannose-protein mannosyltransferase n=1 Tax=Cnuella takakiae TaxID=1302690 RepID=A0A1M5AUG6_9BACT|nr:hypothetical protein [Cnuella takakiae]OLY93230.1 hypothetical protein BUE76_16060 [Cnuella takakiae]SHF33855.1 hypothetical protein SAMN05444008_10712 [Cnuella takakiae]